MPGRVLVGVEGWRGSSGKVFLALKKEPKEGRPISLSLWSVLGEVPVLPPSCLINMLKMAEQKEGRTRTLEPSNHPGLALPCLRTSCLVR